MSRRSLKVVGNQLHTCNNSSSRYARENHYAILVLFRISYVLKLQDEHNASYFSKMSWRGRNLSDGKFTQIF